MGTAEENQAASDIKPKAPPDHADLSTGNLLQNNDTSSEDISPEAAAFFHRKHEPLTLPLLGWRLPPAAEKAYYHFADKAMQGRYFTLKHASPLIINNASNLIGITHIGAEMMMLKANNTQMLEGNGVTSSFDYIRLPLKNTWKTAKFTFSLKDMADPHFYVESLENLVQFDKAAKLDSLGGARTLVNRWQGRATLCGIAGMLVAATLPDDDDNKADVEKMSDMYYNRPLSYYGKRLEQAINPLEWSEHKRQFSGFAMGLAGAASVLSGFRNISELSSAEALAKGISHTYRFNWAHSAGGMITLLGGTQLWAGLDDEQGWRDFGKTMSFRMLFLFNSIKNRFSNPSGIDPGRWWYTGGQAAFTSKDIGAFFIGGAEKDAQGNLIDKKQILDDAMIHANGHAKEKDSTKMNSVPTTSLDASPRQVELMRKDMPVMAASA